MADEDEKAVEAGGLEGKSKTVKAEAARVDWSSNDAVLTQVNSNSSEADVQRAIAKHIEALAEKHEMKDYNVLLLIDTNDEISRWHADRLYAGATAGNREKDVLLVMQSAGGQIEPAYLISKTCRRLTKNRFVVAVPRKAKSAATLIALGADEIHMGLMSELGPIDPQISGMPALAMHNALDVVADLSCKFPGASEMLARYLIEKLDLNVLGYFTRVTESAVQYAERLLEGKTLPASQTPTSLSQHFVNHYKDHGFVIDADESEKLLGPNIVKKSTKEYLFANAIYESLAFLSTIARYVWKKEFDCVGQIGPGGIAVRKRRRE